jgi:hypothetical protein
MDSKTKKITLATFKSFVKKAFDEGNLYVKEQSRFDGMMDCVASKEKPEFYQVRTMDAMEKHTLGICGLWLVYGSRDCFRAFENSEFIGIELFNSCGSCLVARRKQQ